MATYGTTPKGIKYPVGSNPANLPVDAKAMADSMDAALAALGAGWQWYTPTWRAPGGALIVLGNGTLTGRYVRIGNLVAGFLRLARGSTTNFGVSTYTWDLPLPLRNGGVLFGSGTAKNKPVVATNYGLSAIQLMDTATGALLGNTYGWAAGDAIQCAFVYETG